MISKARFWCLQLCKANNLLGIILAGIALVLLAPVFKIFYLGLTSQDSGLWHNLRTTVLPVYLWGSLSVTFGVIILTVLIALPTALIVARYRFPFSKVFDWALLLPLVFPPYVMAIIYRELLMPSGLAPDGLKEIVRWLPLDMESRAGMIFAISLALYPYLFLLLKTRFRSQVQAYHEAAQVMGFTPLRSFTRIALPLAVPTMIVGLLLIAMETLSDYGVASILGIQTLSRGIHHVWFGLFNASIAAKMALFLLLVVGLIALVLFMFHRGRSFADPISPSKSSTLISLSGPLQALSTLVCLVPALFGVILPLLVILSWSIDNLHRVNLQYLYQDLFNSLSLAALTTLVCLLLAIGFSIALRSLSRYSPIGLLLRSVTISFTLPGMVVALGVLALVSTMQRLAPIEPAFAGIGIIVYALTMRLVSIPCLTIASNLQKIPRATDEALAVIERPFLYKLLFVRIPLIKQGIVVGGIIVFIEALKELNISLVLQPFDFSSLSLRVYHQIVTDQIQQSGIWSLCITLVAIYPILALNRLVSK